MLPELEYSDWVTGRLDGTRGSVRPTDRADVPGRFFDNRSRFRVRLAGEPTATADALGQTLDTR